MSFEFGMRWASLSRLGIQGLAMEIPTPPSDYIPLSAVLCVATMRCPISVIERDGMCSIREGGDGSSPQWCVESTEGRASGQSGPPVRWR